MTPVNKNDVVEIEIDGLGYDGEGIAHIGGYTVFVRYALPGEKVRALIILAKPTFAVGKLQNILRLSPDRVEPFCPVYGKCGGCVLQHMSYAAQLEFKRKSVEDTFFKSARLRASADKTVESPLTKNYRNKMSLPVRGNPAQIGFFALGSHRVVPVYDCPVQFEGNGKLIEAFGKFLHENGISGYNETDGSGSVRHITARKLGDFYTVTVVSNGNHSKKLKKFDEVLRNLYGEKYAYYINYNTLRNNVILGKESELIGGTPAVSVQNGLEISVHPQSFFQVNDGVRELLYREAAKEADASVILDAYSGAGVLSSVLARTAEKVIAVEIEPKAVDSANAMLTKNGIANVQTVCGDCAEKLPRIISELSSADKSKLGAVLDPPRSGCDSRVLEAIISANPPKIIYISCNPATLARDCSRLISGGYEISRLTPFDMFPHSANVETLCVLERK